MINSKTRAKHGYNIIFRHVGALYRHIYHAENESSCGCIIIYQQAAEDKKRIAARNKLLLYLVHIINKTSPLFSSSFHTIHILHRCSIMFNYRASSLSFSFLPE